MQSIYINILHKNFQEDHINSRRFLGFSGGFLNSSRFPGVIESGKVFTAEDWQSVGIQREGVSTSAY